MGVELPLRVVVTILECCVTFSIVKLSIRSFVLLSQILLHRSIEFLLKTGKKIVLNKGVYTDKELNSLIGMELKSQMLPLP